MTPTDMIRELADELKDVLRDLDETNLRRNPDEEFTDLASRLVLGLSRKRLTLAPVTDRAHEKMAEGAFRILNIFTEWIKAEPGRTFTTGFNSSGKFEVVIRESDTTRAFFQGESVQDAYGQAAQVISFNGGTLCDDENN